MGRRKKWALKELTEKWESYKIECRSKTRVVNDYSSKDGRRVLSEIPAPVPPSITGFLVYIGMSRRSWYEVYSVKYPDFVEQVRNECEVKSLEAFMQGESPAQLAPIVLANYGYHRITEQPDEQDKEKQGIQVVFKNSFDGSKGYES